MLSPTLLFGKYRGMLLADVPDDYLNWLEHRRRLGTELRRSVEDERLRRRFYAAHCLGPWWWYAGRRTDARGGSERMVKR